MRPSDTHCALFARALFGKNLTFFSENVSLLRSADAVFNLTKIKCAGQDLAPSASLRVGHPPRNKTLLNVAFTWLPSSPVHVKCGHRTRHSLEVPMPYLI